MAMHTELKRDDSFQAPAELASALHPYGSAMTHPGGKVLFSRGEKAHGLFLLLSGSARLSIPGALDRSVGPGSLLGVPGTLSKGIYSLSAELLEESQVLFVPSERVAALLAERPAIGFQMVQLLSREVQCLRERITELDSKTPLP
ncbi:MAG TPA: Crp/Fnr family transcriptional regulator [Terriglobales bacterium]|jgi:CRP-like cAMP-binding protein|nr:Crp/Fnr family transcriptional regulator [Terriglobales bacterium]